MCLLLIKIKRFLWPTTAWKKLQMSSTYLWLKALVKGAIWGHGNWYCTQWSINLARELLNQPAEEAAKPAKIRAHVALDSRGCCSNKLKPPWLQLVAFSDFVATLMKWKQSWKKVMKTTGRGEIQAKAALHGNALRRTRWQGSQSTKSTS